MSTPHFALAQHPETDQWIPYVWHPKAGWCAVLFGTSSTITRVDALVLTRDMAVNERLRSYGDLDTILTELDRLIAIERDHAAGDEAHVQTIRALHPDGEVQR